MNEDILLYTMLNQDFILFSFRCKILIYILLIIYTTYIYLTFISSLNCLPKQKGDRDDTACQVFI